MGIYQYSEGIRRPLAFTILLLLTITLLFTILAVSLHNLYQVDIDILDSTDVMRRLLITMGAFSICQDFNGLFREPGSDPNSQLYAISVNSCGRVTSDCKLRDFGITVDGVWYDLPDDNGMGINCAEWNAFRGFFIMTIIFTALSIVTTLLYTKRTMDWGMSVNQSIKYYYSSLIFMILSSLCLIIAWAMAAATITDAEPDDNELAKKGPAFALAVTGWVTQILAIFGFIFYFFSDPNRKKGMDSVTETSG